jgi:hypothetical protein
LSGVAHRVADQLLHGIGVALPVDIEIVTTATMKFKRLNECRFQAFIAVLMEQVCDLDQEGPHQKVVHNSPVIGLC